MVLLHLPRSHISLFTHFTHFSKPKPPTNLNPIFTSTLFSSPKSTLSVSEPIPISPLPESHIEPTLEEFHTQLEIPLEKLFVPPETELKYTESGALSTRILKGSNILLSKYARDAQVTQAEFVKSSVRTEDCPANGLPEFALVGRSNVGKSSLLNSLVRRKKLALTSKKPGKTQCINHFRINDSWYLVDLPGYGYAAAPQELRTDWVKFTKDYFLNRSTLVSVFLLIDASIPAKKIDLEYASWLGQNQIPMTLIFTKCDKRKKKRHGGKRAEENVNDFQELIRGFFQTTPPWIMTSSFTNQGRDEMLLHMAQLRNYWLKH
ncbi:GTP-binding protein [Rosa sericea]|uniref:Putative GTP-binding protein, ribosome biogenesis, YsxC n=1 Tax=Rosa chinensis TaxID=74649 RepID=A0A2P6PZX1_ROSCH|nr:GTP-binding protein At2g22870 [Rosa chinensis]PRQ27473.1 putative GTP-binding protein, ribosome biogenesis, YsxC [Rosa chinensis]